MTLMLRSVGVEARVGVGFLPGAVSGGEYIVSTRDAHAWVEANIPGTGWIAFDPTPGRAESSSIPPETEDAPATPEPLPETTAVPDPTPQQEQLPEDVLEEPGLVGSFPTEVLWAMLGVALLATPPVAKSVRRRRRQRGPPDAVVVGAYDEFVDRARDLGRRQHPSETVREFAARTLEGDASASQLATLSALSLYGPGSATPDHARDAWTSLRAAERVMAKRSPWYRKVLAFFDPRTFIPDRPFRGVRARVSTALGRA
jgi:transglutaminase-like putative cysteine protease